MNRLRGVTCFKCEAVDKKVKATMIIEYMGTETPICDKCFKNLTKYHKVIYKKDE
jgi:protein-arginine kinase activator protein McsA